MPKIIFVNKDGSEKIIEARNGQTILELAHQDDLPLEGACEGSLACSTCHVIVDPEFYKHEKFMEFYREHGSPKIIDKKPFLIFIKEMLPSYPEIPEARKQTILEWVNEKMADLKNMVKPVLTNEKIKWNGSPSQFGFLINSLVTKGFIEPPLYNGETNFSGLARLCYDHFDIETTIGNLTKEVNPEKNSLSDTKRSKFDIPNLSDLA